MIKHFTKPWDIRCDIPLVSVCTTTYNHVSFIIECMDSILMQETDFPFELLIHDDASIDGTADLVRKYAEKYPNIILPIFQEENQYSQNVKITKTFQIPRSRGKYIALCEGDDYWSDPSKLQKQVAILEKYPECVAVFHDFTEYDQSKERMLPRRNGNLLGKEDGFWVDSFWDSPKWITQPLTAIYRKQAYEEILFPKYQYGRDVHLFYHLLKKGRGYWMNESLGVYRLHEGGIYNELSSKKQNEIAVKIYGEIYKYNLKDIKAKERYFLLLVDAICSEIAQFPKNVNTIIALFNSAFKISALDGFSLFWRVPKAILKKVTRRI